MSILGIIHPKTLQQLPDLVTHAINPTQLRKDLMPTNRAVVHNMTVTGKRSGGVVRYVPVAGTHIVRIDYMTSQFITDSEPHLICVDLYGVYVFVVASLRAKKT